MCVARGICVVSCGIFPCGAQDSLAVALLAPEPAQYLQYVGSVALWHVESLVSQIRIEPVCSALQGVDF